MTASRSAPSRGGARALSSIPKAQPDGTAERDRLNFTSAVDASDFSSSAARSAARASRAKWLQTLHGGRELWLQELEAVTALHRNQKAARLTARAVELGKERRRAWREGGAVARSETGNVRLDSFESQWHASRAKGALQVFSRVKTCGGEQGYRIKLTCRGCSEKKSFPVGCDQAWFCATCRNRRAQDFRIDVQAKLGGLTQIANRAGLTARTRRHQPGGRFGARFITLTVPHAGGPRDRIRMLTKAWPRFWRLLSDHLRGRLSRCKKTGVFVPDKKRGKEYAGELREATLWDLVHFLWVIEWTPGDDGDGHPHLHLWLFSPWIDRELVEQLWRQAYNDAGGTAERMIVDVRKASHEANEAARELCKYLVKDWEVGPGGSKQARPEVYAQAFAELDGRRMRQTSSGFAHFKLAIVKACPCCGHTSEAGHWAFVELDHTVLEQLRGKRLPWAQGPPTPPGSEDDELETFEWMTRRAAATLHAAWLSSADGQRVAQHLRDLIGGSNDAE